MKPPNYSATRKIMKKIIAASILTLCFTTTLFGQDFKKFKIAFKISPNASWMVPQNQHLDAAGSSIRFGYGANVDIHFTENYALGTGLNIDNNGGRLKYMQEITRVDGNDKDTQYIIERERDYNMKYVEVPISLKLRTNEIGYVTYWGQFGVGLGYRASAKANDIDRYLREFDDEANGGVGEWAESIRPNDTNTKVDIKDDTRAFRTSLVLAAGIEYNVSGSTSIVAGLTFDNGFSNVIKGDAIEEKDRDIPLINTEGPVTYKLKSNSNYLALTVGILF